MTAMTSARGSSGTGPMYVAGVNPPYLVDYTSLTSGKRLGATKRRVRFRFGFSNADALLRGQTGIECRGSEHDVTLVWSVASGKRLIVADGKEVHYSVGKATQGKFQFAWNVRGNHILKIVAHSAKSPLKARDATREGPWRQFDLFLDGRSVLDMPRIFELGLDGGRAAPDRDALIATERRRRERTASGGSGDAYNNYSLPTEEENAWARRVEERETAREMNAGISNPEMHVDTPADLMYDAAPATDARDLMSAPVGLLDQAPAPRAYEQGPDPFAPRLAPAPVYEDVAANIMSNYAAAAPASQELPSSTSEEQALVPHQAPAPTYYEQPPANYEQQPPQSVPQYVGVETPTQPTPRQAQFQYSQFQYGQTTPQTAQEPATPATASPQSLSAPAVLSYEETPTQERSIGREEESPRGVDEMPQPSPEVVSQLGDAFKKLVNLDDINAGPEEKLELMREKLRKNPFAERNGKVRETKKNAKGGPARSRGIAPISESWATHGRSLGEIKSMTAPRASLGKEVMKANAFDPAAAQAGMMVVYGQTQQQQQQHQHQGYHGQQYVQGQGPPPLQQGPSGFGVGAQLAGGGYAGQAQAGYVR
uniref:Uncharacterized protein n=1 Tax=Trieres chinensis TaxID=1514140 RepID=A0A7S2A679_TRICV|mmetsp:Transcript_4503/g.9508  ORF Transcript_4503/g.9508 Transcript_4503/m.9508 type:complete len:596 (+) Transcript_4503:524-2311(+)|eukprot:CAMPEP_0183309092 /NCGR_PEP_ID=MMETSP0160_2-20130417/23830_1 /TAXON_ID=2839 ORGANISM="Odontella Sinensis, Strain Grunow 1884" /NCGR_SAMPLE_ID=MMETSP0160_2 /ASSEMBLY_ACC=CAM_ASM_000250 /LENGTH=595 /DNA_ID=CAMNT_0025473041 /DNA_START=522 /DNA_END=2309 /DNA_ORIENTATION=+